MANLFGTGINQVPTNGMLGNLAFQDKAYVSVDKIGIGTTAVDTGTANQTLQNYGGAYVSGNLGVGATNPTSTLQVAGTFYNSGIGTFANGNTTFGTGSASSLELGLNNTNNAGTLKLWGATSNAYGLIQATTQNLHIDTVVGATYLNYYDGDFISFGTGAGAESARFTGSTGTLTLGTVTPTGTASQLLQVTGGAYVSGSVGIGTTNPLARLSVGAGSLSDGNLPVQISTQSASGQIYYGANNNGAYGVLFGYDRAAYSGGVLRVVGASDSIDLVVNNTTRAVTINPSGSVGIGTTNPSDKLHTLGGNIRVDSLTGAVNFWNGAGYYGGIGVAGGMGGSGTDIVIRSDATRSIIFFTGGANDRGRIDSSGTFLVGSATSTGTANQKLQVTGGAYVSGNVGVGTTVPAYILTVTDTGTAATSGLTNCLADFTTTANSYGQINLRNTSTGTNASGDVIITADNGSDTTNFIDLGINNSGFSVGSWTINGANDGYLYTSDGNLSIGAINASVAKYISFFTGGTLLSNERMRINAIGVGIGSTNPTSKLDVVGDGKFTGIVTATQFTTGSGNLGFTTNTINGPSEIIIDPLPVGVGTTSGIVRIRGDLYVDGTQFVVNSSVIELADLRVGIATTVGTNSLLDGGGIGIGSANILKTITWNSTVSALTSSEDWSLASGKQYEIDGTSVLTSTTLGSGVVNSSLTSVGTLGQLNVSGIATASTLVATKNAYLGSDFTNSTFGNGWVVGAPVSTTYYKIATLPASTSGTFDHLTIEGVMGGWINDTMTPFKILFSNRNGFDYKYESYGTVRTDARILGISTNNTVEVWAQHQSGQYTKLIYSITNSVQASVVANPTSTTTAPVGTTVFDSSSYTPRFIINESDNVGINSTTPTSRLDVVGDAKVSGITTSSRLTLNGANSTADGGGQIYLNGATGNRIDFNGNGSAAPSFTTRSAGTKIVLYPQVGASAVDFGFGIEANAVLWSSIPQANSVYAHRWYGGQTQLADLKGSGELVIGSSSLTGTASQRLQVTGGAYISGNLGVGRTNPSSKLEVLGTIQTYSTDQTSVGSFAISNAGLLDITAYRSTGGVLRFVTANSSGLNLERGRVDSSGNFIIGATSETGTASQPLQVTGGAYVSGNLGIGNTNPTSTLMVQGDGRFVSSGQGDVTITHSSLVSTIRAAASVQLALGAGGAEAVRINTSNNVGINSTTPTSRLDVVGDAKFIGIVTATDFNTTSDENLKTNIIAIEDPLDKIVQIRGVNFEWKENGRRSAGVIAQEIEKVLPELVNGGEIKTVNYNGLIGLLIEVVKEQQSKIESLESRLSKLE